MQSVGGNCDKCKNRTGKNGYRATCKAFPQGIPFDIMNRPDDSKEECANGFKYNPDPELVKLFDF